MTNKGRSMAIRAELKKLGYNSKQVSVRSGFCGYSDYTNITIKDVKADKKAIENVCKKFQSIRYDEFNGEILQGANTYIHVQYDYSAMAEAIKNEEEKVNALMAEIEKDQKHIKKNEAEFILYKQGAYYCIIVYESKEKEEKGISEFVIRPTDRINDFKYSLARLLATDFNY